MGLSNRIIIFLLLANLPVQAQIDQEELETFNDGLSANLVQDQEQLSHWLQDPLNLNEATMDQLLQLPGMDNIRAHQLTEYRRLVGVIRSKYELIDLKHWDQKFISSIESYIILGPLQRKKNMLYGYWKHELIIRSKRVIEKPLGAREGQYIGDALNHYLRYTGNKSKRIQWGLAMEKDAWEPFYHKEKWRSHRSGFVQIRPEWMGIKTILLGSFRLSIGQGIVLKDGFRPSTGPQIRNTGIIQLRGHASSNESNFQNGIFIRGSLWQVHYGIWRSATRRSMRYDTLSQSLVTWYSDGIMRTEGRNSFFNNSKEGRIGGFLHYQSPAFQLVTALERRSWSWEFQKEGRRLVHIQNWTSAFVYRNSWGSIRTEYAHSEGRNAMEAELLLIPDDQWKIRWVNGFVQTHRQRTAPNFAQSIRDFQGQLSTLECFWNPFPFQHFYMRLSNSVHRRDATPGSPIEVQKRWSAQHRYELRSGLSIRTDVQYDQQEQRTQFRFQFRKKHHRIQLTLRGQWNKSEIGEGSLAFIDCQNQLGEKSRLYARFSIFQTTDFNHRLYAYENDVLYAFSVPAFYGNGHRFYLMIKMNSGIHTIWIKGAMTTLWDKKTTGSLLEERIGPHRSEITVQYKVRL